MTVDEIMVLADAFRKSGGVEDENALRAAVEQIVRERDEAQQQAGECSAGYDTVCREIQYWNERAERAESEAKFLHQRRGELVIERDRYKAALAEYPEGRDVFLAGALAEVEKLKERAERAEREAAQSKSDALAMAVDMLALQKALADGKEIVGELHAFLWNNIEDDGDDGNIEIKATDVHAESLCALLNECKKWIEQIDAALKPRSPSP